ncbi:flagellar basal-body rod protein FlgB [Alkalithermobacter thermoalcaliphilus JW-YL-7 = DSM 7308]|uniref:Flagellar basal body rod protein FlgB n=1 Tax=Alkalithermobacter thermoalcaliphilus JW-YL-7 = DSM 7308 TaxID=1121328 RepID=A0A150FQ61_CLOPD|nr:flagellar basal-body rod protein FlgB [[Clostridium] paradoxum JW-YL-7 = DSM 7308]SHK61673.1 flagellar basal-body rod protein FlgB [[Clostridium] paradoxum JW-YL-7 = DSM 7308]
MNINKNINLLSKALDMYSKRNQLLSNNIANANTPNYKRKDIKFNQILTRYQTQRGYITNEKHIEIGKNSGEFKIYTDKNTKTRLDGNNVDIDVEMAELSKNSIAYNTVAQQISNSFRRIKYAITEGRR